MPSKPTYEELESRIREVIDFFGGELPVEHALAWQGYIGALSEWGLLNIRDCDRLYDLLGRIPAGPMLFISLGPEGAKEVMEREQVK